MRDVKFSVLMSVYVKERASYLEASLDSVINQTLSPSEIIIVEDGPLTNELNAVLAKYQKKHPFIKTVRLAKNIGLGLALNEGLRACSNTLVARMDTDDIAHEDRFEKQISFMLKNPEIDMISANIAEYDDSLKTLLSHRNVPERHDSIIAMMKSRSPFNHMAVVYKKDVVLGAGGYEHCLSFEDYYLWCKLANSGARFHNLQKVLINMRTGDAIAKRRGGLAYARAVINFQRKIRKLEVISNAEFVKNVMIRGSVAMAPEKLRLYFYKKALRR